LGAQTRTAHPFEWTAQGWPKGERLNVITSFEGLLECHLQDLQSDFEGYFEGHLQGLLECYLQGFLE
jgi:hypothetical protein